MAKNKLIAARATRERTTASAQVADVIAKPGRPAATSADTIRTNVVLSRDVSLRIDEKVLALKRAGSPTSFSGLVEVLITEGIDRPDLADVVARYGLGLRRK